MPSCRTTRCRTSSTSRRSRPAERADREPGRASSRGGPDRRGKGQSRHAQLRPAGIGSGTHLNLEKFKLATGIDVVRRCRTKARPEVDHRHHRRAAVSTATGRRSRRAAAASAAARLRPLAVSTAQRSTLDCRTCRRSRRQGCAGFEATRCGSACGDPAGMPAELANKINSDVRAALARPGRQGAPREPRQPGARATVVAEFTTFVRSEIEDYAAGAARPRASSRSRRRN